MVKAVIRDKEYLVPTTWSDVPYSKAIEVLKLTDSDEILCALTGIDKAELETFETSDVYVLFNCVKFIEDVSCMEVTEPEERFKDFDYGSRPYGDTEAVKKILAQNSEGNWLDVCPKIIEKLTGIDISKEPFDKVVCNAGFFLKQWIAFTSNTKNLTAEAMMTNRKGQELEGLKCSVTLLPM